MNQLVIRTGDFTFEACFEDQLAPKTCAALLDRLAELCTTVLWKGAQKVRFEVV
jgi:hypothetical protein